VTIPGRIGKYEIRKEVGRGTMGIVYEAYDASLDRRVALKTISVAFAPTPEERQNFEKRFFAEARIAAALSHPGIVIVHDVGRDPESDLLYMALEFLEGRTLAQILREEPPLPWPDSLQIVKAVAEALDHAHSRSVVHRDIKPANIMILPNGQPKLMDFGIAHVESSTLTIAGQVFGTPLYMSPEQAQGEGMDGRTDLFSLGSVAYALLTRQTAFSGENTMKIIGRVVHAQPSPPSQVVRDLPEDIDYLVARALAKNVNDRYPTGRMLAEDAEDILAARPPRHRPDSKSPLPPDSPIRPTMPPPT